ncbi:MAG: hypothetical protein IIB19_03350 [Chloroflexi bacterium]|nr:hypothetical protein [Chloroflexota bacterium]
MLRDDAQADDAAPVVHDEGDVAQVEFFDDGLAHPLDVLGDGVVSHFVGLVGASEADHVERDYAVVAL